MNLDGKVALVMGGSRGIGRAIALLLAERGAKLVINYNRNLEEANAVVAAIEAKGGQAIAVQGDVSIPADAQSLVEQTVKTYGRIDILVNNAGITKDTLMMRMSESDWDSVLDTNLKGAYLCAKAALRPMLKTKGGRKSN